MGTLGIGMGTRAVGGGAASLVTPESRTLEGFLWGMLTGALTGAGATFGPVPGFLIGGIVHGGAAYLQGETGPVIMMSSLFGMFGGMAGGLAAGGEFDDLALALFLANFDASLLSNLFK
jgi:hypothetical protein